MNADLSNQERAIVEKWRRQYRHRWLACGLFGVLAVVGTSVATLLISELVGILYKHGVPFLDVLTLNWFQYLGEATTNRLLLLLAVAMQMILASAAIVAFLIVTFRIGFRRYRVMEKLLRADGMDVATSPLASASGDEKDSPK